MRLDLHVHTNRSIDSLMTPSEILRVTPARHLDGLAITDHNTIDGALELRQIAPFLVIVGEEVRTTTGEIIGLFLQEDIPPDLSPEETIAAIRAQGGIVYVPHPFDRWRHSAMGRPTLERIVDQVDALEVFNARNMMPQDNELARYVAEAHGLAKGAGSDAHMAYEIGRGFVEIEPFDGPASFLAALHQGRVGGERTTAFIHAVTTATKFYRRLTHGRPT